MLDFWFCSRESMLFSEIVKALDCHQAWYHLTVCVKLAESELILAHISMIELLSAWWRK